MALGGHLGIGGGGWSVLVCPMAGGGGTGRLISFVCTSLFWLLLGGCGRNKILKKPGCISALEEEECTEKLNILASFSLLTFPITIITFDRAAKQIICGWKCLALKRHTNRYQDVTHKN